MLTHPTSERLVTLGLTGMAKALDEQLTAPGLPETFNLTKDEGYGKE